MSQETIHSRILRARTAAQLTQEQLAALAGVSSQAAQQWESGRAKPTYEKIPIIAPALGVSILWLAFGIGLPEPERNSTLGNIVKPLGGKPVPSVDAFDAARDIRAAITCSTSEVYPHYPCSDDAFRVVVWDRSNSPLLEPGDSVIIDPDAPRRPNDIVFASTAEMREPILGRLRVQRIDNALRYEIVPTAEGWPHHVVVPQQIIGVMTEHATRDR